MLSCSYNPWAWPPWVPFYPVPLRLIHCLLPLPIWVFVAHSSAVVLGPDNSPADDLFVPGPVDRGWGAGDGLRWLMRAKTSLSGGRMQQLQILVMEEAGAGQQVALSAPALDPHLFFSLSPFIFWE